MVDDVGARGLELDDHAPSGPHDPADPTEQASGLAADADVAVGQQSAVPASFTGTVGEDVSPDGERAALAGLPDGLRARRRCPAPERRAWPGPRPGARTAPNIERAAAAPLEQQCPVGGIDGAGPSPQRHGRGSPAWSMSWHARPANAASMAWAGSMTGSKIGAVMCGSASLIASDGIREPGVRDLVGHDAGIVPGVDVAQGAEECGWLGSTSRVCCPVDAVDISTVASADASAPWRTPSSHQPPSSAGPRTLGWSPSRSAASVRSSARQLG